MSLLSAHGIEKSYGVHRVLAGVSVTIAAGERVGLVGNNGSEQARELLRCQEKFQAYNASGCAGNGGRLGYGNLLGSPGIDARDLLLGFELDHLWLRGLG